MRKATKQHGMQKLIEGPDVAGRRVLVVEDTSTTGASVLTAVRAVREAGATVVGVATVVDRATGAQEAIETEGVPYRRCSDWPISDWADRQTTPWKRARNRFGSSLVHARWRILGGHSTVTRGTADGAQV